MGTLLGDIVISPWINSLRRILDRPYKAQYRYQVWNSHDQLWQSCQILRSRRSIRDHVKCREPVSDMAHAYAYRLKHPLKDGFIGRNGHV
jgi:hypothetical protein